MRNFLTITSVTYETGDIVGYFLAWCSLIPIFMFVAQVTAFVLAETHKRRLQSRWLLVGQLFNEGLNIILKRLFKVPRPSASTRNDYGMPSSHSQFMAFTLVAILTLLTANITPSKGLLNLVSPLQRVVSWIYLGYHDFLQVGVGAMIGILVGYVWRLFYLCYQPIKYV